MVLYHYLVILYNKWKKSEKIYIIFSYVDNNSKFIYININISNEN